MMVALAVVAAASVGQLQVQQVVVPETVVTVHHPRNVLTTLTGTCSRIGKIRFSFLEAPEAGQRRIRELVLGKTVFRRDQLSELERLFGNLRANYGSISDCGGADDGRVSIHVSFVMPMMTPERTSYVATIYVRPNGVSVHPRDLAILHVH